MQLSSNPRRNDGRRAPKRKLGGGMELLMIGADEVDRYIQQGDCALVDLRQPSAYRKTHLRGARNIPYEELEEKIWQLPFNRPVILYCERGSASLQASKQLSSMGIRAISVAGGISAYRGRYLVK